MNQKVIVKNNLNVTTRAWRSLKKSSIKFLRVILKSKEPDHLASILSPDATTEWFWLIRDVHISRRKSVINNAKHLFSFEALATCVRETRMCLPEKDGELPD